MVDELMLRDVNNILKKLELIRTRDDFEQILIDNGLVNASREEIDEFVVNKNKIEEGLFNQKDFII